MKQKVALAIAVIIAIVILLYGNHFKLYVMEKSCVDHNGNWSSEKQSCEDATAATQTDSEQLLEPQ